MIFEKFDILLDGDLICSFCFSLIFITLTSVFWISFISKKSVKKSKKRTKNLIKDDSKENNEIHTKNRNNDTKSKSYGVRNYKNENNSVIEYIEKSPDGNNLEIFDLKKVNHI